MLANWLDPNCHTCLSGLTVEINHGNGLLSFYGHMSELKVTKGQSVSRGQVIGISGSTGSATGPHLHWGVYKINGGGPVDPYGWTGSYPDPYRKNVGDLWLGGSPRFASIAIPKVTVTAASQADDPSAINVSWSSPGDGNRYKVYVGSATGALTLIHANIGPGSMVFRGKNGQSYWFWVSVTTNLGWTDASGSELVAVPRSNHGEVQ
jgi:hypothetical protein